MITKKVGALILIISMVVIIALFAYSPYDNNANTPIIVFEINIENNWQSYNVSSVEHKGYIGDFYVGFWNTSSDTYLNMDLDSFNESGSGPLFIDSDDNNIISPGDRLLLPLHYLNEYEEMVVVYYPRDEFSYRGDL